MNPLDNNNPEILRAPEIMQRIQVTIVALEWLKQALTATGALEVLPPVAPVEFVPPPPPPAPANAAPAIHNLEHYQQAVAQAHDLGEAQHAAQQNTEARQMIDELAQRRAQTMGQNWSLNEDLEDVA